MNIVFIRGKIIGKIEYRFMINKKKKAIVYFDLLLENNSILRCKAYNEMADYCYRNLVVEKFVNICGRLESDNIVYCNICEAF